MRLPTDTAVRAALALLALALAPPAWSQGFGDDFERFWQQVKADYPYFATKQTDWDCVHRRYAPQANAARSRGEFIPVLERAIDELYDPHASLNTNLPSSTRLVPTGLDAWAEWRDGAAIVTQLVPGARAERAGLRPGMQVTAINGVAIADAVHARLGHCLREQDAGVLAWGLLAVLAGTHDTPRVIAARDAAGNHELHPDELPEIEADVPGITARALDGGIGYIAIHHLGDSDTVGAFDAALLLFKASRGLVLDLRDTAAGGSTEVAEPIMGRLIARAQAYQRVQPPHGPAWRARVQPRGPFTYRAPLVVLVSRWTGSMGEGMAIGLDGMHRASVVGTRMAGLNGGVFRHHLPASKIDYSVPGESLLHLDGTARERFVPPVAVDLLAGPFASAPDPILAAGLEELRRLAGATQH
jgi:carboxyl-terminal processing protease